MSRAFLSLCLVASVGTAAAPAGTEDCRPVSIGDAALRAVVVIDGSEDPSVAAAIRLAGANTFVTQSFPTAAAATAASGAGLRYIARVTIGEILRLRTEASLLTSVRALPGLAGFEYLDTEVVEGFSLPATQRFAYETLKRLFPSALVVTATRLDPIAWQPDYLDSYFRPEFSDMVIPYFYPVGTTLLGSRQQDDPWENDLRGLLRPLADRIPAGKEVLPVLQAFEQDGYPVDARLVGRQWSVYREIFPGNPNVAAFWWGGGAEKSLTGMSARPMLLAAFRRLFGAAPSRRAPCVAPGRSR